METLKIDTTNIFLEDLGDGKGRITISDDYRGAFNHYWGSMGCSLNEFLINIDSCYFAGKLCRTRTEFDAKKSVSNIRKYIKTELSTELPFWKFMPAQKELRESLNELEDCETSNEFIDQCLALPGNLFCFGLDRDEEEEFKSIIAEVFTCEPWLFIEEVDSSEVKWLMSLHGKIKKL